MSADSAWYLYLLECTGDSIYTGITTDVARRFAEHLSGKGAKYTRSRKPIRVLGQLRFETKSEALKAEIEIKRLSSTQKRAFARNCRQPSRIGSQQGDKTKRPVSPSRYGVIHACRIRPQSASRRYCRASRSSRGTLVRLFDQLFGSLALEARQRDLQFDLDAEALRDRADATAPSIVASAGTVIFCWPAT